MRKMKKVRNSFKYAIEGIWTSFKTERNMKIHLLAVVIVLIMGYVYKISNVEWMICIVLFGLVISAELINTGIEQTVNLVTEEKNPIAKYAKDVSAGAVLVNAIVSVIIAGIIWIPKIF